MESRSVATLGVARGVRFLALHGVFHFDDHARSASASQTTCWSNGASGRATRQREPPRTEGVNAGALGKCRGRWRTDSS